MIRKLLALAMVLVALLVIVVVLVARGSIGGETLRRALEQQLSARVGKPVTIAALGASFFPRVTLDLHGISVGQPAGATIAEVSIATGLRGLFSRRVEDAEVIVSNSRIPVQVALGIAGAVASGGPAGASDGGLTIVSVRTLAFRHVELVAEPKSLTVDLESSLAGDHLEVTRLTAESAGTRLEAKGALSSVAQRKGSFTSTASRLNLDELLALASAVSGALPQGTSPAPGTAAAAPSAMDLVVQLTAPGGELGGYTFQALTTTFHITAERLRLEPLRFGMFGGQYDGQLSVTPSGAVPDVGLEGRVTGMDVATVLKETRGSASMSGKIAGTVSLTARGTTSSDIVRTARGTGRVTIANGAIPGLEMVRPIVLAFGKPSGAPPTGSGSAFSRIDGAFSLADETLRASQVVFNSRDFDMTGDAIVKLSTGGIDMHASVMLSRELTAQAGTDLRRYAQEDGRIVVPAVITGTVAAPSVMIDVAAAVSRALQNEMKRRVKGLFDRIIK